MAEARSAVSYRVQQATLSFVVTDEELVLRINKNIIPTFLISVKQWVKRSLYRLRNGILKAVYPTPPYQWFVCIAVPAGLMLSTNEYLRPATRFLWNCYGRIPNYSWLPVSRNGQAALMSIGTGVTLILVNSFLRRFTLRLLLSYHGWLYDNVRQKNWKTLVWGFMVRLVSGRIGVNTKPLLYGLQGSLPHLPVPNLSDTCDRYLRSVRPLMDNDEYDRVEKLCNKFQQNEGRKLNFFLKLKSLFTPNYVTDWWDKYVYLRGRTPIIINSNYYILDSKKSIPPTPHPSARAARLTHNFLKVKRDIELERLEPMVIQGTVPMCMWQYERIFSVTRIPGKETDKLEKYENSRHIAVLCRGRWYVVQVYDSIGRLLSAAEIESQFKWIESHARRSPPVSEAEGRIAALTTDNRTTWAQNREEYLSAGVNRFSLSEIESAIFCVILEIDKTFGPTDYTSMARHCFHGDGHNLWVDKSFNFITFADGRCGFHVEHSWADAPVISHMFEIAIFIDEYYNKGYDENGWNIRDPKRSFRPHKPPMVLKWDLSQQAERAIQKSYENARAMIADIDLQVVCHSSYGKGFIKNCKVSPDAYVQLALQLAYKRDAGKFALTYESAMTRLFLQGRTETVRPATLESAAFVNAFEDPNVPKKEKIRLLYAAAQTHQKNYRDAMTGKGIDRHLFALYVMSMGLNINSEFLATALSTPWSLSTSQQPQNQTGKFNPLKSKDDAERISPGGGFGPVADNGYGVSYMVATDTELWFHCSSKINSTASATRFIKTIFQAFADIKTLFDEANAEEAAAKAESDVVAVAAAE